MAACTDDSESGAAPHVLRYGRCRSVQLSGPGGVGTRRVARRQSGQDHRGRCGCWSGVPRGSAAGGNVRDGDATRAVGPGRGGIAWPARGSAAASVALGRERTAVDAGADRGRRAWCITQGCRCSARGAGWHWWRSCSRRHGPARFPGDLRRQPACGAADHRAGGTPREGRLAGHRRAAPVRRRRWSRPGSTPVAVSWYSPSLTSTGLRSRARAGRQWCWRSCVGC